MRIAIKIRYEDEEGQSRVKWYSFLKSRIDTVEPSSMYADHTTITFKDELGTCIDACIRFHDFMAVFMPETKFWHSPIKNANSN